MHPRGVRVRVRVRGRGRVGVRVRVSTVSPAVWQMQQPAGCCFLAPPGFEHSAKRSGFTHGGRWLGSAAQEGSGAPESSHISMFS